MLYQQLINGLMLGASYSLIAIGYTLIFGVLNLLYFAHGEVFMIGAFAGLFLVLYAGANIYGALIGASTVIQNLAVYLIGGQQLAFPETIAQKLYRFGPITISQAQIFILGVA